MQISKIRSQADVVACVNLYAALNDDSFLPVDYEKSIKSLSTWARRQAFVRIGLKDGEIVAWIYAAPVQLAHVSEPLFQQIYYASNLQGFSAAKAAITMHELMIEQARLLGISWVSSAGSHMDPTNTLARILEKRGWQRRGYMSIMHLKD